MKLVNALKKWLLKVLVPYIEGMPYIDSTNKKKSKLSQEQRFRDLFKKRKSALILGAVVICFTVFGIGKSFIIITGLIACSPFVVIFWSSFGEALVGMFEFKKNKK
tara:strand:+ start:198 stop:515 length:318 start_codon:yes stop_codon:yes gene_type:complete